MAKLGEKLGKLSLAILENFVESKLGTKFIDELRAPTDRALAIAKALEETEKLCTVQFEDKDLARALFVDLKQADRPVLKEAVGKYFDHPTDPSLRNSLREILFTEFKDVLSQEQIDKAVNEYLFILTKELMLADEKFRDNRFALSGYEGNLTEKQELLVLEKIYEAIAGLSIQYQNIPTNEIHPTIGFIPAAKVVTYIDRGQIEDDITSFLLKGGTGAIVGLHAPGGLGKTELAKKTAKKLGSQYEVLWIDVGKKKPQQVIGDILMKCGVQSQPTASYDALRNELQYLYQQKRFLIIFDDVRKDALESLTDFLPPNPNAALVTSRVQQIGGVKNFSLNEMTWEQAQQLFEAILTQPVVENEIEDLRKLATRCAFNPLAMEIAARRILQQGGVKKPVAKYFEIAKAKFAELKMDGDARWDMERIFEISYLDLSMDDREKFESLAVFHPTGFSIESVSYLWNLDISLTRQVLLRFVNLSIVKVVETEDESLERYRLHDLLDEYASLKLKTSGKLNNKKTELAKWLIDLFDDNYTMKLESFPIVIPEKDNLLNTCEWARGEKQAEILALLTTKTRNWFFVNFSDSWIYWFAWLEASLQLGIQDNGLEANVLQAIGDVQQFRDDRDAALESYNEALKLFRQVGAKLGEANVLQAIGDVQQFRKENDAAKTDFQNAFNIYKMIGDQYSQARALYRLGDCLSDEEKYQEAINFYENASELWRSIGVIDLVESIINPRIEDARKQIMGE